MALVAPAATGPAIDIRDIVVTSLKLPGVRIDREKFLRNEFKDYPERVIKKVIKKRPALAKIPAKDIDRMADGVIARERLRVTSISTALGMPGGVAMAATIPADIAQYYGCMLRTAQMLMYLYGFPQIETGAGHQQIDDTTMDRLIICIGVMYGVANANNAIKVIANSLSGSVSKKLAKTALTKGTIYPIVKEVAKWFGQKMTKEVFAGFFKNAIPVVGGVIGGAITFASFKPCCDKLKENLQDTELTKYQPLIVRLMKRLFPKTA